MEICTGIKNKESLKSYIDAGATEFYCGLIDHSWLDHYDYIVPLNRRPWPEANFQSFVELEECVKIIHDRGLRFFFTLNEHCYYAKQFSILKKYIEEIARIGVDAVIVADIGMASFVRSIGFEKELHISTGGVAFNHETVEFYQKQFGADRIILPRALSIKEINDIVTRYNNIDFEIFIKNEGCTYIDGLCNFVHGIKYVDKDAEVYNPPCELRYKICDVNGVENYNKNILEERLDRVLMSKGNCGICSLFLFNIKSIKSLKVVSRDTNIDIIAQDIRLIKKAIKLCEECTELEQFKRAISEENCKNDYFKKRIFCYYPEVISNLDMI